MTDIHALAGAYALDALTEIERAAFRRHLAECESCATEAAELAETAARLADLPVQPPQGMRAEVLARARATAQVGPVTGPPAHPASSAQPAHPAQPAQPAHPARPARPTRPAGLRRRTLAAVAAAVVVAAGASGTAVTLQQRLRDEQRSTAAAENRAERIEAVLTAPDARIRSGTVNGGQMTVVLSDSRDEGVAVLADAPFPGAGRAYQFWLITGDQPVSAGVVAPGDTDATRLLRGVRGATTFGVTVEPAGGSPRPTLPAALLLPIA